jgi:hypothetical protein
MNFARSSTLFVVIGIFAMPFGGGSIFIGLVGLFAVCLGLVLGVLSLFGVGRPADQPYKAPWITLSLGCAWLLIVCTSAITTAFRVGAHGGAPVAGPFIDQVNGFRLDNPGEGWKIISKENLLLLNGEPAAGAKRGPDMGGYVFVETLDPGFRIAGREQEVGEQLIDQFEVDDKRVVFNRPDKLDGQPAVRCQVVGTIAGRGIRYEAVALIANGRLYCLTAFGPSDLTSEDGLAFRPFMTAFHLLPSEPRTAPPVLTAPSAPK